MLGHLKRAFGLVDALSRVNGIASNGLSTSRSAPALASDLSRALQDASATAPDADVARHLELRADAVIRDAFDEAIAFGAMHVMPYELSLSHSPVWTHPMFPGALSATLGRTLPAHPVYATLDAVDAATTEICVDCLDRYGLRSVERAFEPPAYSVCDLTLVAGQAAIPPFHFASFLPEDEGVRGVTTKTIVYQNLYLLRFIWVSEPLVTGVLGKARCADASQAADLILPQWLRAHDVAHSFFDNVCRRSGLGDNLLHAVREILADSVADAAVLRASEQPGCLAVILGEKLRYGRRNPKAFADALAARVETGWIGRTHKLASLDRAETVAAAAIDLIDETIARLVNGDLGRFESWITKLASEWDNDEAGKQRVPDDVVPLFANDQVRSSRAGDHVGCSHR